MKRRLAIWFLIVTATTVIAWLWPRIERPPSAFEVARAHLDDGDPNKALLLFEDPVWRGIAEYRAGRYARAVGEFFKEETILNLYNMGNTFAQLQDWNSAIASYQRVLRFAPRHRDAQHNLALVIEASELAADEAVSQNDPEQSLASGMELIAAKPDDGEAVDSQSGQSSESDQAGASSESGETGEGQDSGNFSSEQTTDEIGSATAIGKPSDDERDERNVAGASRLKARETMQAAEILLRKIQDDPEKVLRARIYTAHKIRSGEETE